MKKKLLATLSLILVLVMIPTFVFGRPSREWNDNDDDDRGSGSSTQTSTIVTTPTGEKCDLGNGPAGTCTRHPETEVKTLANGAMISTTGATLDKAGYWYRLAINMKNTSGTDIVSNNVGGVAIGNVHVHFASGQAEVAGLPTHIVSDINALNSGKSVHEIFGSTLGVDLSGYTRVGGTRAVILTNQTTGLTNTGTEFILDVSPLDAAGTYAVVYYDNHTGRWNFLPVTVDPTTKLIKLYLPGSCTVQLLKKN